jgi:hypothetical protein
MSEGKIQLIILLAVAALFVIPVILNLAGVKGVPMPG